MVLNQLPSLKEFTGKGSFSLCHLNICYLKKIHDLERIFNQQRPILISLLFQSQDQSNINSHQLLKVTAITNNTYD